MIKYKGKYPHRIHSVWSVTERFYEDNKEKHHKFLPGVYVMTNCGGIYRHVCRLPNEEMPKLGEDISFKLLQYAFITKSSKRS